MSRPDVWHLIAPAPFGGAESVVESLAIGRREGGRATGVILLTEGPEHPLADRLRAAGVVVVCVTSAHYGYRSQVRGVAALLTRDAVLHTHAYQADVVGFFAARRVGCAIVASNHGYAGGGLRNRLYEWLDRQTLRRIDAVLAVSKRNADRLRAWGHRGAPLFVIPNGWRPVPTMSRVEARAVLGVERDGILVGWIGRMSEEKGGDLLIAALQNEPTLPAKVCMIGDGPERAHLEATVRNSRLEGVVHFTGALPNPAQLSSAFDLLAISSRTEGLPMVMLEATNGGAAIVSFAVGGIPEYLDESSAWLVRPGDVSGFHRALIDAVTDTSARAGRAERARSVLNSRLGLVTWLADVESVYDRVRRR